MIVCHCTGTKDQEIRAAASRGVQSCAEVGRQCGAGAACGGCVPLIRELLSTSGQSARSAAPKPAPER